MDNKEVECTDEIRHRIWNSKKDLPGSLYLLSLEKDKTLLRTAKEQTEYGHRLRSDGFFSSKHAKYTYSSLLLSTVTPQLKPALYQWMEKYTSDVEFALTVACFAMSMMIYLKDQISKEAFHTTKIKKHGAIIKSFKQLFHGSRFENVLDLVLGILEVHNQGVNARTAENKIHLGRKKNVAEKDNLTNNDNTKKEDQQSEGKNEKKDNRTINDDTKKEDQQLEEKNEKKDNRTINDDTKREYTEEQIEKKDNRTNIDDTKKEYAEERTEKKDNRTNIDNNQKEDKQMEGQNVKKANRMANNDNTKKKDNHTNMDNTQKDDNRMDTDYEVNHEEDIEVLLVLARAIPEKHVFECFEMEYKSFLLRLNGICLQDRKQVQFLRKMYAKYCKWNKEGFSKSLPGYVAVPNGAIQKFFQCQLENASVLLKVKKIEGDGNCLYRSLAESMIVRNHIPKFKAYEAKERYRYVREVLYGFAKANKIISYTIWKQYVEPKKNEISKKEMERYESWVKSLLADTIWGGQAEYTLFAYAFNCHVLCLRQLKHEVEAICTREFNNKIPNDTERKRFVELSEVPKSPRDVVFIWHHWMQKPREKLGMVVDGFLRNGDHYSFLGFHEKRKKQIYHDTFLFEHNPPAGNYVNLSSPVHNSPNPPKMMPNTDHQSENNVATRKHKKRTCDSLLPFAAMNSDTKMKKSKSSSDEEVIDHAINKMDTSFNNEDVDQDVDQDIDLLPSLVRVPLSDQIRGEMVIAISEKYLYLEPTDNDGRGNCFYDSILQSNAFSKTANFDFNKYTNAMALREDLQRFAVDNEQISKFIFDLEVDSIEKKEWAGKHLIDSIKHTENEETTWISEVLMKDAIFSEAAVKIAGGDPSYVLKTLEKQCEEDKAYTRGLIENNFTKDQITKMAKIWWLKSIGTDLAWGGRPEMLLFCLKFQKHLVILSNQVDGPQVDGTCSAIAWIKTGITEPMQIQFPEKSKANQTIFLWAMNPDNPLTPMKNDQAAKHYVTLNMFHNKRLLTKKRKSNAFCLQKFSNEKKE